MDITAEGEANVSGNSTLDRFEGYNMRIGEVRNEDPVVVKARDDKSMDQGSGSRNREGTDFKDTREEAPEGLINSLYLKRNCI